MPGTLFVVATPIGNLEDITMRALRILREVALIAAEDTRRTAHLLARYAIPTPTTSFHEHNEAAKTAALLRRLQNGDDVALVSDAGTPVISDPGRTLVDAALKAGIKVEPVPGPNAAVTALAASGFSGDVFTFLGFPPIRSKARKAWLARLHRLDGVVIFYEAPHRVIATLTDVLNTVGDRPVLVARELTKIHQELVKSTISAVLKRWPDPRGEFTFVVDIGQTRENIRPISPDPATLRHKFGQLIESTGIGRRAAIAELSKSYGIPSNEIYRLLEAAKK
jgi:16S rRNA (cytidine1402-2'-O)-methyltransferase